MNCTYTRSIGCTPYKLVFNRKPNYRRIPSYSRAGHEIEDEILDDNEDQDGALKSTIDNFREEVTDAEMDKMERELRQQIADRQLAERLQYELQRMGKEENRTSKDNDGDKDGDEVEVESIPMCDKGDWCVFEPLPRARLHQLYYDSYRMRGALRSPYDSEGEVSDSERDEGAQLTSEAHTNRAMLPIVITDSQETSIKWTSDEESEKSVHFDPEYSNHQADETEDSRPRRSSSSKSPPKTPQNEERGEPDDLLSPPLNALKLGAPGDRSKVQELDSTPTTAARVRALKYQKAAQERSMKQFGKQRNVHVYEVGQKVSVGIPREDRSSTDDKRVFGRVIQVFEEMNQYQVVTRWGVLDRYCPINIVNPLEYGIDVDIPDPAPSNKVTLSYCAAQQSTSQKVKVKCDCKDKKRWCSNRTCKCIKAGAKCSVHCHQSQGHPDTRIECPNAAPLQEFTRMGLGTREQRKEQEQVEKRQRQDAAGRWVGTKGIGFGPVDSEGNVDEDTRRARENKRRRK